MGKITTLDTLEIGQSAKVTRLTGENSSLKRRIMDMGITKGVVIKVVKKAPLGDPVLLELRGYNLSIRAADLKHIEVEVLENKQIKDLER